MPRRCAIRCVLASSLLIAAVGCSDNPSEPGGSTIRTVPGSERQVTQHLEPDLFQGAAFPDWSPDGQRIAFVSAPDGPQTIWTIRADGTDPQRITDYTSFLPSWSPDGSRIAHLVMGVTPLGAWWVLSVSTSEESADTLTHPPLRPISVDWSQPDALLIDSGHEGSANVWLVPLDEREPTRLTNDPDHELFPVWSPDGQWIAYTSQDSTGASDLFVMERDGTHRRNLTQSVERERLPTWSSDGAWIAFAAVRDGNEDIWAMPFDGGEAVRLTDDEAQDSQPDWSPDGKKIAFVSHRGGGWAVWTIDVEVVEE